MTAKLPENFLENAQKKVENYEPISGEIAKLNGKTYIGVKVIHAAPMTLGEYHKLRKWTLPANKDAHQDIDQDANKEGYLVEYTDKEDGNVKGFNGYVSWSPKDVFEAAYVKIPVN